MATPGWYQDPEGRGWRWWDGSAWGPLDEPSDPIAPSSGGAGRSDLGIDARSRWATRLTAAVAVLAGCGAVVAGAVLLYTAVVGPLPGEVAAGLAMAALPLVLVGQLLTIGILLGRSEERRRATGRSQWWRGGLSVRDLRGGLPWPALVLAGVVFSGVWIATFVPWAWESSGDRLPAWRRTILRRASTC